jgi:acetyl esterase
VPVDPELTALLSVLAAAPPLHEGTPQQGREAMLALTVGTREPEHVVPVAGTEDLTVPGESGELRARVYRPDAAGPLPIVVLLHGGGWVIGDIETHDNMARSICRDCRAVVMSVDYRLAPEAPFPAAVEDAVAATLWAAGHADQLGGDGRVAVAGDSAGGNLAAVVCQQLVQRGGPPLVGQLLIYPATDVTGEYPSRLQNGEGYFLETATMAWFINHYAPDPALYGDPRLSPLNAEDLSGLPPAVVITAEYDPLRDEGEAYAARLQDAGVPTLVRRFDGMIHGFFDMGPMSSGAQKAVDESCAMFADVLESAPRPGG